MKRNLLPLAMVILFVLAATRDAFAGILPDPFAFSFFTDGLTALFLLPFQLAGCG